MDNDRTGATPSPDDKSRYEAARKEVIQALQKKRIVDKQLAQLEVQIYNFENSYLTDTAQHSGGNIIQGFDGYLKTQNVGRRRHEPTETDRVFSTSSLTYQKSLELLGDPDEEADTIGVLSLGNSRGPTPGLTTVVLPAATQRSTQELTAAQQKKARDKEYQRRKRASQARERALAAEREEETGESTYSTSSSRRQIKKPKTADDG